MKANPQANNFIHKSRWTGMLVLVVAALTLEATALIQFYYSRKGIREEASKRAESQLENTKVQVLDILNQAENAVRNNIWLAGLCLTTPDTLPRVTEHIVRENPVVIGSTVALLPDYNIKSGLLSPYSFKDPVTGQIISKSLATEEYDYPSQEWFLNGLEHEDGFWSEPYIDTGGGDIVMTTFSMPVKDPSGKTAAVITADISLDWLTDLVGGSPVYPNAYNMIFSRSGKIMVCPVESLVMRNTFHEVAGQFEDTAAIASLNRSMFSGETGSVTIRRKRALSRVYYAPIERAGWYMSVVIPDKQIFSEIRKVNSFVNLLQAIGILMLFLILRNAARNQKRYNKLTENKDRMENELRIARDIQMSMIPKVFPPFPERDDLDISAILVPAREVGGDLYDFFIRDEKLFFCIGDVSGKGVPASLVMAVTRSLFRTISAREESPGRIVSTLNDSMVEMNESNMFVTFFCGILDLATGRMRFCNAGHNAPMTLTDAKRKLDVVPNLPLGIIPRMEFQEQEIAMGYDDVLFLYTDGLTEAENAGHELFGETRMANVLSTRRDSRGHLLALEQAVADFVKDAPRSDDLTMLLIHYVKKSPMFHARHIVLKNDIQQIPFLNDLIHEIAEKINLDESLAMGINLALEEAVTNVMMYAYPEGVEGKVNVDAFASDKSLKFIISDRGKEFDPTAKPEPDITLKAEDRPIGGLGIHLVRKIMDSVSYKRVDGKNMLTMIKNI